MTHERHDMTPIEQLRELMRKATPGPWKIAVCDTHLHRPGVSGLSCEKIRGDKSRIIETGPSQDANLIIAMRNHLPALLAVVESAQILDECFEEDQGKACALANLRKALAALTTESQP
jgi:hypothetical protein